MRTEQGPADLGFRRR
uniref:Uncharacterized protein n=1 Tax=Arundo donax TaxID=35708 RepID=A0A0A9G4Q7_ARUDO